MTRVLAVLVALLSSVGCTGNTSPSDTSLSGTLSYTAQSGNVRRLADQEVVLVRSTPEFEAAWKEAVEKFIPDIAAAWEASETASEQYLEIIRKGTYGKHHEERKADTVARVRFIKLRNEWDARGLRLIDSGAVQRTRTDNDGQFKFRNLPPGDYYIFVEVDTKGEGQKRWWVPVKITEEKMFGNTLNLDSNQGLTGNATRWYFWPFEWPATALKPMTFTLWLGTGETKQQIHWVPLEKGLPEDACRVAKSKKMDAAFAEGKDTEFDGDDVVVRDYLNPAQRFRCHSSRLGEPW